MHLAEEQLQRFVHGELADSAAREVQRHLLGCSDCRLRVEETEREDQWVQGRLAVLDHPLPLLTAADVIRAAGSSHSWRWGRWAAGIFLAAAVVGGAYAAPGSPLPRVLAGWLGGDDSARRPVAASSTPERSEAQVGIAVAPGTRLTVSFPNAGAGDTAVLSLSDRELVMVQARGGHTTFRSEPERLIVDHWGDPGQFQILIPRTAPLVALEVNGRRILLKNRSGISAPVAPDSLGRYVMHLVPSS